MIFLIGQMICCLLLAALLGFVIGWLLKGWYCKRKIERLEQTFNLNNEKLKQDLSSAQMETSQHYLKVESSEKKIIELENELDVLFAKLNECEARLNDPQTKVSQSSSVERVIVKDDLKQIKGIGRFLEGLLNQLGITSFRQIAEFDANEIERVSRNLDVFPNRILRDRWVEQAKELHFTKYNERIN